MAIGAGPNPPPAPEQRREGAEQRGSAPFRPGASTATWLAGPRRGHGRAGCAAVTPAAARNGAGVATPGRAAVTALPRRLRRDAARRAAACALAGGCRPGASQWSPLPAGGEATGLETVTEPRTEPESRLARALTRAGGRSIVTVAEAPREVAPALIVTLPSAVLALSLAPADPREAVLTVAVVEVEATDVCVCELALTPDGLVPRLTEVETTLAVALMVVEVEPLLRVVLDRKTTEFFTVVGGEFSAAAMPTWTSDARRERAIADNQRSAFTIERLPMLVMGERRENTRRASGWSAKSL